MPDKLIIIGAGGHAHWIIDALRAWLKPQVYAVLDDNQKLWGTKLDSIYIIGGLSDIERVAAGQNASFIIAIGHPPSLRAQLFCKFRRLGLPAFNVEHTDATLARPSYIGDGSVVLARAVVGPNATIGDNCIINTAAIVEHDVVVGHSVHVAPGAILLGGVKVEDEAFIGAGAIVLPGLHIGYGATVGAGAVVLHDVGRGQTVVGNPARLVEGK